MYLDTMQLMTSAGWKGELVEEWGRPSTLIRTCADHLKTENLSEHITS